MSRESIKQLIQLVDMPNYFTNVCDEFSRQLSVVMLISRSRFYYKTTTITQMYVLYYMVNNDCV